MKRGLAVAVIILGALYAAGCCTCPLPDSQLPSYRAASFEVESSSARMFGVIDHTTPDRIQELVVQHPEVTTIVMIDVPGSEDDASNLRAARLIREYGFRTVIPSEAVVASGGVDFFLAGKEREIGLCAKLGVHSWEDENEDGTLLLGSEAPRDHESHGLYLDFYRDMGVSEDFYWYTLEAASPDRIHWMSQEEIRTFGLATGALP